MAAFEWRRDPSNRDLITTIASTEARADNFGPGTLGAGFGKVPSRWDLEADVVVVGAGAAGLPAAIKAADAGAFRASTRRTSQDGAAHAR